MNRMRRSTNPKRRDMHVELQIDSEWYSESLNPKAFLNKYITLQVGTMTSYGDWDTPKKMVFEHPDWKQECPEDSNHLPTWEGETAIPEILNHLHEDENRFRQARAHYDHPKTARLNILDQNL